MGSTRLCVTVTGRTTADLRAARDAAEHADLVELRLDTVTDPSAAGAIDGRRLPVIVTCRPRWEGGQFDGAEEDRRRLLREAQDLGAEFVDVEWQAGFEEIVEARNGRGVVLSMHDFTGVPDDLGGRVSAMRSTGAEVVKVAVMTEKLCDALPLLAMEQGSAPLVLVAMGEAGLSSRVFASRFGSCWTYAGDGIAPGQIPASRLVDELAFRRIGPGTAFYGVVGRPVLHSLSPAMHNAAFEASGIDAGYVPLAAADFEDFLRFADAMDLRGASVTAPFKVDAFDAAASSDEVSRRIRAVNTLRQSGAGWDACNTDVEGFLEPLAPFMPLDGRRATILGAGGAARGVAEALSSAGARVSIAARRRERAEEIARLTNGLVAAWPPDAGSWDLLVNTTPVGTAPDTTATPLPSRTFTGELVYDLVYIPPDTQLLRDARAAGCRTLGGLDMLVAQAERQFAWWTGRRPPAGVMRSAALAALRRRGSPAETLATS